MSTLVELITALVFGVFGISEEIPPENNTNTVVIEYCDMITEPSIDMLQIANISSIKIEQNSNENNLL